MFVQMLLNGLVLGSVYSLIALGLTLIFAIMNVMNFAHGQMYMLGGFVVYYFFGVLGLNYFFALLMVVPILSIVGIAFNAAFRRVQSQGRREESSMLLAMGLALLIENIVLLSFGEKTRGVPRFVSGEFDILGAHMPTERLFISFISIVFIAILILFIQKTKPGRALRAIAQDREVTYLQGVNVKVISMLGFAIGATLAGLSGGLLALVFPIFSGAGTAITTKSFLMILIGGAGVVPGAIVGGFILGILESFGYGLIAGSMTYLVIFVGVILLLIFRPQGVMGKPWG